jgi:hypothetical protein
LVSEGLKLPVCSRNKNRQKEELLPFQASSFLVSSLSELISPGVLVEELENIRHAERTTGTLAHRTFKDVPSLFRCIHALGAHESTVIADESMQRQHQRGFFVFSYFRGYKHSIRKHFACIGKEIFS